MDKAQNEEIGPRRDTHNVGWQIQYTKAESDVHEYMDPAHSVGGKFQHKQAY